MTSRTRIILAALVLISASSVTAFAKDWSQMNVAERLAWTTEYAGQVCPYGLNVADKDGSRKDEIASAPQLGVKVWVRWHCKTQPITSASR